MAEYTTNYNLIKPAQTDFFNVDDLNENADKIDAALKTNADGISAANTAIGINAAAIAENSTAITGNTAAIRQNTSDIATNTTAIGQNASNIAANTTAIGARVRYADALTLEEIIASTDLTDKVASASAAKSLRESLSTLPELLQSVNGQYSRYYLFRTNRTYHLHYERLDPIDNGTTVANLDDLSWSPNAVIFASEWVYNPSTGHAQRIDCRVGTDGTISLWASTYNEQLIGTWDVYWVK